jgi:membrane protein
MAAVSPNRRSSSRREIYDARPKRAQGIVSRAKPKLATLSGFWTKISNDSIFNLAGLLAYNFLMSSFPILLVILAIGGSILTRVSPAQYVSLENAIAGVFPGGTGREVLVNVTNNLNKSIGVLFIVGILLALITGSGLFLTIEWCFGIVFRLRGRNPIRQRLMSIGMLLLYAVLIPIVLLASLLPSVIVRALPIGHNNPVFGFFVQAAGVVVSVVVAAVLFGAIYIIVPNRKVVWGEAWKGTLVAALLLVIYETLFPFYTSFFLHPQNYGSTAAFAVVILIFFYYLAFILVLGAEINSWAAGQRETAGDIPAILHEVQAHNTTFGAAGPTAGTPQEDMAHHKGAAAMRTPELAIEHERVDHKGSALPPKFAETGVNPPGYNIEPKATREAAQAEAGTRQNGKTPHGTRLAGTVPEAETQAQETTKSAVGAADAEKRGAGVVAPPEHSAPEHSAPEHSAPECSIVKSLGQRQKRALWAVVAAGTVAIVPVLRLMLDLLHDDDRSVADARDRKLAHP